MKRLLFAVLAAATACGASPVLAQEADPWTATVYAGSSSVLTRGQKNEYLTSRVTVAGPIGGLRAFVRADAGGTQDAGSLDSLDPSTFRSLEVNAGLTKRVGLFDLGAAGGVSYSIEGGIGAPVQPRMYTGVGLAKLRLRDGGYIGGGAGWYGPVGGAAIVLTASVPVGKIGAYATTDFALPVVADALSARSWLLIVGATVRVKTFDLAGLAAGK